MNRISVTLPYVLQKIGYVIFFVLYKVFVRLEIKRVGNLEKETGPFIFAFNHTHELDATLFPFVVPFWSCHTPIFAVSAPQEKYKAFGWRGFLYGGKFFNALGAYSVFSGQQNYAYALQTHEAILKNGYSVCIFPEGKRTLDGSIGPARGGLGYLVYASGVPVVPVAINTFYKMSPRDFFLRKRSITITIGHPLHIPVADPATKESFTNIGESVLAQIRDMCAQHS